MHACVVWKFRVAWSVCVQREVSSAVYLIQEMGSNEHLYYDHNVWLIFMAGTKYSITLYFLTAWDQPTVQQLHILMCDSKHYLPLLSAFQNVNFYCVQTAKCAFSSRFSLNSLLSDLLRIKYTFQEKHNTLSTLSLLCDTKILLHYRQ